MIAFLGGLPTFLSLYFSSIPSIYPFPASDPNSALAIPFVVSNNSLLFDMHEVRLGCVLDITTGLLAMHNATFIFSPSQELPVGSKGDFFCDINRMVRSGEPIIVGKKFIIELMWNTNIFGYRFERKKSGVFTILHSGSGYYWMEGGILQ